MNSDNPFILQKQIRDNAEEHQSFLRDLDNWEKEMKKKENELKLLQVSEEKDVPPVRNSSRSKPKSKQKKEKIQSPPKDRLSSYDYKSWEKFDVENELKKLDGIKKESSGSDGSDDETERLNILKKKQLAIIKKDKGNVFFKKDQYDDAINSYSAGMILDPENALLPANRAMAFLKKGQFQAAENDCSLCLSRDPTYVKAYLRRGAARKGINKLPEAKEDFLQALKIDPKNKQAQQELDMINEMLISLDVSHEMPSSQENSLDTTENTSGKIKIINIEDNVQFGESDLLPEGELRPVKFNNGLDPKEELTKIKVEYSSREAFKDKVQIERNALMTTGARLKEAEQHKNSKSLTNQTVTAPLKDIEKIIAALEHKLPPVPSASFQFLTDWKKISKNAELKYQYLKQFPPDRFSSLFKHYIEPEVFPEIICTLSTSFIENGDDVFYYMKHLATVGRFETMLMFLSEKEKKAIKKLKSYLETSQHPQSDVENLLKLYPVC